MRKKGRSITLNFLPPILKRNLENNIIIGTEMNTRNRLRDPSYKKNNEHTIDNKKNIQNCFLYNKKPKIRLTKLTIE
jgi:hypothetical protein